MLSSMVLLASCGKKDKKGADSSNTPDPGHTHVFDIQSNASKYLASPATCTSKAKYYKSCECGEKGTETFEFGEVDPNAHSFKESDWVEEVAATVQFAGTKGHYHCEYCDKYFDKELNVMDDITIPVAAVHNYNYKGECTDPDCDSNILNSFVLNDKHGNLYSGECNATDGFTGIYIDEIVTDNAVSLIVTYDGPITAETPKAFLDVKAYDEDGNALTVSYILTESFYNSYFDKTYGVQTWRVESCPTSGIYFITQLAYNSSFEFIIEYYQYTDYADIVIASTEIVK